MKHNYKNVPDKYMELIKYLFNYFEHSHFITIDEDGELEIWYSWKPYPKEGYWDCDVPATAELGRLSLDGWSPDNYIGCIWERAKLLKTKEVDGV